MQSLQSHRRVSGPAALPIDISCYSVVPENYETSFCSEMMKLPWLVSFTGCYRRRVVEVVTENTTVYYGSTQVF